VEISSAYGAAITQRATLSRKATTPRPRASAGEEPDISLTRFTVINRDAVNVAELASLRSARLPTSLPIAP
jgi:hypothetical protein